MELIGIPCPLSDQELDQLRDEVNPLANSDDYCLYTQLFLTSESAT